MSGRFFCEVCESDISGDSEADVFEHNLTWEHRSKLESFHTREYVKSSRSSDTVPGAMSALRSRLYNNHPPSPLYPYPNPLPPDLPPLRRFYPPPPPPLLSRLPPPRRFLGWPPPPSPLPRPFFPKEPLLNPYKHAEPLLRECRSERKRESPAMIRDAVSSASNRRVSVSPTDLGVSTSACSPESMCTSDSQISTPVSDSKYPVPMTEPHAGPDSQDSVPVTESQAEKDFIPLTEPQTRPDSQDSVPVLKPGSDSHDSSPTSSTKSQARPASIPMREPPAWPDSQDFIPLTDPQTRPDSQCSIPVRKPVSDSQAVSESKVDSETDSSVPTVDTPASAPEKKSVLGMKRIPKLLASAKKAQATEPHVRDHRIGEVIYYNNPIRIQSEKPPLSALLQPSSTASEVTQPTPHEPPLTQPTPYETQPTSHHSAMSHSTPVEQPHAQRQPQNYVCETPLPVSRGSNMKLPPCRARGKSLLFGEVATIEKEGDTMEEKVCKKEAAFVPKIVRLSSTSCSVGSTASSGSDGGNQRPGKGHEHHTQPQSNRRPRDVCPARSIAATQQVKQQPAESTGSYPHLSADTCSSLKKSTTSVSGAPGSGRKFSHRLSLPLISPEKLCKPQKRSANGPASSSPAPNRPSPPCHHSDTTSAAKLPAILEGTGTALPAILESDLTLTNDKLNLLQEKLDFETLKLKLIKLQEPSEASADTVDPLGFPCTSQKSRDRAKTKAPAKEPSIKTKSSNTSDSLATNTAESAPNESQKCRKRRRKKNEKSVAQSTLDNVSKSEGTPVTGKKSPTSTSSNPSSSKVPHNTDTPLEMKNSSSPSLTRDTPSKAKKRVAGKIVSTKAPSRNHPALKSRDSKSSAKAPLPRTSQKPKRDPASQRLSTKEAVSTRPALESSDNTAPATTLPCKSHKIKKGKSCQQLLYLSTSTKEPIVTEPALDSGNSIDTSPSPNTATPLVCTAQETKGEPLSQEDIGKEPSTTQPALECRSRAGPSLLSPPPPPPPDTPTIPSLPPQRPSKPPAHNIGRQATHPPLEPSSNTTKTPPPEPVQTMVQVYTSSEAEVRTTKSPRLETKSPRLESIIDSLIMNNLRSKTVPASGHEETDRESSASYSVSDTVDGGGTRAKRKRQSRSPDGQQLKKKVKVGKKKAKKGRKEEGATQATPTSKVDRVELEGGGGAELKGGGGVEVELEGGGGVEVELEGGGGVEVEGGGGVEVELERGGGVKLEGEGGVELEVVRGVELEGGGGVKLEGVGGVGVQLEQESMSVSSSQQSCLREEEGGRNTVTPHERFAADIATLDERDKELQEKLYETRSQVVATAQGVRESESHLAELEQQQRQLTQQRTELTDEYKKILIEKQNLFSPTKHSQNAKDSDVLPDLTFFSKMTSLSEREQDMKLKLLQGSKLLEDISLQRNKAEKKLRKLKSGKLEVYQNELSVLMRDYKEVQRQKQELLMSSLPSTSSGCSEGDNTSPLQSTSNQPTSAPTSGGPATDVAAASTVASRTVLACEGMDIDTRSPTQESQLASQEQPLPPKSKPPSDHFAYTHPHLQVCRAGGSTVTETPLNTTPVRILSPPKSTLALLTHQGETVTPFKQSPSPSDVMLNSEVTTTHASDTHTPCLAVDPELYLMDHEPKPLVQGALSKMTSEPFEEASNFNPGPTTRSGSGEERSDDLKRAWMAAQALSTASDSGTCSLAVCGSTSDVPIEIGDHGDEESQGPEENAEGLAEYNPPHENSVLGIKVFDGHLFSCSSDKTVKVYDTESCQEVKKICTHKRSVTCVEIFTYRDRIYIVSGSSDKHIIMIDAKTGEIEVDFSLGARVMSMLTRQHLLVAGLSNGYIHLINLQTKSALAKWRVGEDQMRNDISCLCLHGNMLFTACYDEKVLCWNMSECTTGGYSLTKLNEITSFTMLVLCMQVDGDLLYCGSADMTLKAFNISTWQPHGEFKGHTGAVSGLCVTGNLLITSSFDHFIRCYDTRNMEPLQVYGIPDLPFTLCCDRERVYCGLKNGKIVSMKIDLSRYYKCKWADCGLKFGIKDHLREHFISHLVSSTEDDPVQCKWEDCNNFISPVGP